MRKRMTRQTDISPPPGLDGSGTGALNPGQDLFHGPSDPAARRARRVILLLAVLWVLNAFDLACTITAQNIGYFDELNPFAQQILDRPHELTVFKIGAVFFASVVLFTYRRLRLVELSCWALVAVYVALSLIWVRYFVQNAWQLAGPPHP